MRMYLGNDLKAFFTLIERLKRFSIIGLVVMETFDSGNVHKKNQANSIPKLWLTTGILKY